MNCGQVFLRQIRYELMDRLMADEVVIIDDKNKFF